MGARTMDVLPTELAPVRVGDFFYTSWGYDQTNVDFYEVVGVTSSGKSVRVQRCAAQRVDGSDGPHDRLVPVPGPLMRTWWDRETGMEHSQSAEVVTKRLRSCGDRWAFFVASYADAYQWDGKPKYQTGAGWGH